jgi:hypothetical protein
MTAFEMLDTLLWRYPLCCTSGFVLSFVAYVLWAAWMTKERENGHE